MLNKSRNMDNIQRCTFTPHGSESVDSVHELEELEEPLIDNFYKIWCNELETPQFLNLTPMEWNSTDCDAFVSNLFSKDPTHVTIESRNIVEETSNIIEKELSNFILFFSNLLVSHASPKFNQFVLFCHSSFTNF